MNCRKLLLLLALLFPCSVLAQTGIAYSDIALTPTAGNNSTSRVMSFATIRVCTEPSSGSTCSPLAHIYSDEALSHEIPNPTATDQYGRYTFYAASGLYHIQVSQQSVQYDLPYQNLGVGALDLSSPPPIGNVTPNTGAFTTLTCTGFPCGEPDVGPVYDIRSYGAVCDWNGSTGTDNTVPLQKAVNDALVNSSASYGVVWIPPGCPAWFSSTVTINATTNSNVFIRGGGAKVHSDLGGSGLYYGGTLGPAFRIEAGGSTANYTYFVNFEDFYLGATAAAPSLIEAWNLEGPARLLRMTLDGDEKAAVGLKCYNCQFQISGGDDTWIHGFTTYGMQFNAGGPIKIDNAQIYDIGQDPTGVVGSGVYAAGVNELNIRHTYTELMANSVEITNGTGIADENYGDYNLEGNYFNNWGSGSTGSPTNTVHQRCLLLHSTAASYPIFTQGRIVGNSCHLGPVFTQGLSLYAFEFDTASNAFRKINNYTFSDNQVSGMTTAAVYADDASTTVTYRNNVVTTIYEVGSSAPVYLPTVAGSGTYQTPLNTDKNGNVSIVGTVNLQATGTATALASAPSPLFLWNTSWWNGSAAQPGTWSCQASEANGTNPTGILQCLYSGSPSKHVVGFPALSDTAAGSAASGYLNMTKDDCAKWRNVGNSGDNALCVNGSDQLTYNGAVVGTGGGGSVPSGTYGQLVSYNSSAVPIAVSGLPMFNCHDIGLKCDGTAEGSAFQTAINNLSSTYGGGKIQLQAGNTLYLDIAVTFPANPIEIDGTGIDWSSLWGSVTPSSSAIIVGCTDMNGCLKFVKPDVMDILSHLALRNTTTASTFIHQTKTTLILDKVSFTGESGSISTADAVNDAIQCGVPATNTCATDETCYCINYGSQYDIYVDKISRAAVLNGTAAQSKWTINASATTSNATKNASVIEAACNDNVNNTCGMGTSGVNLICTAGDTITFNITGGAVGSAQCTTNNHIANGTELTLPGTTRGIGYTAAPTTATATCAGTCTGTAALTSTIRGNLVELVGTTGAAQAAIQNFPMVIYGEFGNPASHTNVGDAHYNAIVWADRTSTNQVLTMGDDAAHSPYEPGGVYNITSNAQNNAFDCAYYQSSYTVCNPFAELFANQERDIPGNSFYSFSYHGKKAGTTGDLASGFDYFILNAGGVLGWNDGSTGAALNAGISKDSAAVLDIGNGTPGDTSGTLKYTKQKLTAVTFAGLDGSPVAGEVEFCSDCQVTTAASCSTATPASCVCKNSGTGAFAKYMNYQGAGANWYCQ